MNKRENEDATLAASTGKPSETAMETASTGLVAGRYRVLGLIGSGGMGTVYKARDLELDELVALKALRRELVDAPEMLERFRREVKLARRVTHKNVARVFDIGEHVLGDGAPGERFLTMELVEGESLAARIARRDPMSIAEIVDIAGAICAGLAAAHAAGVVHRDLKPDNILLEKGGRVVLTDFGIARALESGAASTMGALVGTPAYMAPEQVQHQGEIDARADIYALGCVLFEMITGERAWHGDAPIAVAAARLVQPPPDPRTKRPDIPTACAELVVRCLQRAREDRFASASDVAGALATLTLPAVGSSSASVLVRSVPPPRPPTIAEADKTVAVLPFRNAGAADDAYLAEELTDDLIDALSMTRGLKVTARGLVQRFSGRAEDPRAIGRELGVQVVVEGSVRRASGNIRASARLISVADGFQVWAKRFDRPEQEVLAMNDAAAIAIVEALTLTASTNARRESFEDPVAADLYLRGRHAYRKFWPDHLRHAIDLFEQALARVPGDPTLLAAIAIARARIIFFSRGSVEEARDAANRAIAADPTNAESHLALGSVELQAGDPCAAIRALRVAVARNPGLAEAHASIGRILAECAYVDEGLRRLELASSLDPLVPLAHGQIARTLALLGRWDEIPAYLEKVALAENKSSALTIHARHVLWRRDTEGAKSLVAQLPDEAKRMNLPKALLGALESGFVSDENLAEVRQLARSGAPGQRRRAFYCQLETELTCLMGRLDEGSQGLASAVDAGLIDLLWIDRCPLLDELRPRPEFPGLRARVKERADAIVAAYRAG